MDSLVKHIGDAPVTTGVGIAALALDMAIKYHGATVIGDGTLYQQYKLEGRNIREINIDIVFETAIAIEKHLLGGNDRVAELVIDALSDYKESNPT